MSATATANDDDAPRLDGSCPACGRQFNCIGQHWASNPSCRPDLTAEQKHLVEFALDLDGGEIVHTSKSPSVRVFSTDRDHLDALHEAFGIYSLGVKRLPDRAARDLSFPEDQGVYVWRTRSSTAFSEWDDDPERYRQDHLTDEHRGIVEGVLTLDSGSIKRERYAPHLEVFSTDVDRLRAIDDTFGDLGLGVRRVPTSVVAEEIDIDTDADHVWGWRSRPHQDLYDWVEPVWERVDTPECEHESEGEGEVEVERSEVESKGFYIPTSSATIVNVHKRLREWASGREDYVDASITICMGTDKTEARHVFEDTPVSPISYADHGDAVDVELDGSEVHQWI